MVCSDPLYYVHSYAVNEAAHLHRLMAAQSGAADCQGVSFWLVALHLLGSARTPPHCRARRCRPRCRRCRTNRQSAAACGRCSTLQPGTTLVRGRHAYVAHRATCSLLLKTGALALHQCSCNAMSASKQFTTQKPTLGLLLAHVLVVHSVISPAHPLHHWSMLSQQSSCAQSIGLVKREELQKVVKGVEGPYLLAARPQPQHQPFCRQQ